MKEGHGREKTESDCFQVTFQSQLRESGPFIENSTYFNIWDGHERSTLRDYQKHIPPRVYWFARHGKQLTPGKTSAKATMVSGDTVYDAGGIRKLKFGSKIYKGMGVCAHTQGCIEGRHGGLQAMEWFRPKFTWVLPAWPPCPFLLRRPGKVSQTFASSCLLTSWVFLFYFFLEENSSSLWVCCGSNKLRFFLSNLKCYKKQLSGHVTASWQRSHKSWAQWCEEATTVSMHQDLCLYMLRLKTHTHSPGL